MYSKFLKTLTGLKALSAVSGRRAKTCIWESVSPAEGVLDSFKSQKSNEKHQAPLMAVLFSSKGNISNTISVVSAADLYIFNPCCCFYTHWGHFSPAISLTYSCQLVIVIFPVICQSSLDEAGIDLNFKGTLHQFYSSLYLPTGMQLMSIDLACWYTAGPRIPMLLSLRGSRSE